MDYPVMFAGKRTGTLSVRREGLYTLFEVHTGRIDGLHRLWLHGGGRCFCLGVLEPDGDGMMLKRRFSGRELTALPEPIEYVSDGELTENRTEPAPAAVSAEEEGTEGGLLWYRGADGCLTAFDGDRRLIALPSALARIPGGADVRIIEGRQYIVFFC